MNAEQVREWIRDPSRLNRETMLELRTVIEEYPCFTAARMLYLKNLLKLNDLHYPSELNRTGISVPDRRRLFYFMEGKPVPESLEHPVESVLESGGFSLIDRFLQGVQPADGEEDDSYFSVKPEFPDGSEVSPVEQPVDTNTPVVSATQSQSIPVDETRQETAAAKTGQKARNEHFALNYVEFLSMQPDMPVESSSEPMKGQDLIDDFLNKEDTWSRVRKAPESTPGQPEESVDILPEMDLSRLDEMMAGLDIPEDSFTDALARIYLKQKRYDRALEIFRSLSLKYPEKSVYFADQIRFLEKLIIHIKK